MAVAVDQADFLAVLNALGTNSRQVLPLPDLAFGATTALAHAGATPVAAAVWLATLTQESDSFRTTTEYGTGQTYAPYAGRTFEQITWPDNYAAFGTWAATQRMIASPTLFRERPALLSETQWAWLGGVWFFQANGLWPYAGRGDLQQVENAVNRGQLTTSGYPSGWAARLTAYQTWTRRVATPAQIAITGVMDGPTSRRLQQWVGVAMDGSAGAVTWSAVQKWLGRTVTGTLSAADVRALQVRIGAYVDGDFGPGTTRDMQRFLNGQA
jgi:hypothetical protein